MPGDTHVTGSGPALTLAHFPTTMAGTVAHGDASQPLVWNAICIVVI